MINQRIIQQIKDKNNDDALATLYKTAYPSIRNYILKNNGNIETVKDVFHDAIIVLIECVRKETFDESKDVNGFLFTVARNRWISGLRKDQNSTKYVDYVMKDDSASKSTETSHDILLKKELRVEMRNVLSKLKGNCQKLLELYVFQNKSMDEIAQEMNYSSRETVKSAHYKCKKKLREFILESSTLKEIMLKS